MPSRGSYQIARQNEYETAQRDQSYRSCVATLLIFFMLCMIILIACIPWKKYGTSQYNKKEEENSVMAPHYGNKPPDDGVALEADKVVTTTTAETTTAETTTDILTEVLTQNYISEKDTDQFKRYYENITAIQESLDRDILETTSDTMGTLGNDIGSTDPQDQNKITIEEVETTKQPELRYNDTNDTISSNDYEISESTIQEETFTTSTMSILEVTKESSFRTEIYNETFEYSTASMDSTSVSNSALFNQSTTEDRYATTEEVNSTENTTSGITFSSITNSSELFTITDITVDNSEIYNFTKEYSTTYEPPSTYTSTEHFTNATIIEIGNISTQETVITTKFAAEEESNYVTTIETTTESNTITTSIAEDDIETCNTGHCKHVAARMLSYMNHSADPCEDFYEYACGGMVADSRIIDLNLANKAYHKIAKQMRNNNNNAASLFITYYSSCMEYENTISIKERIALVKEAINRIGQFYTIHDRTGSYRDFTTTYATLLLSYSPLLFDVEPDLNEYNSNLYTISIGPVLHKNLFDSENIDELCYLSESEIQQPIVDLESIYNNYTECKQNNTRFIKSIYDALMALGIFNDTDNNEQNASITAFNIDNEIVQGFFFQFPSQAKIREAYLMKNYTRVSMEQLNRTTTFINWDRLIFSLMRYNVERNAYVQIYFYKELENGLQHLESFWKRNPMNFHNAILGLYAHKLYHDLVVSKHEDVKQHCLRVSTNLLRPEASNLYMTSLSDKEIAYMNRTIRTFFDELKETLKIKIRTNDCIMAQYGETLLKKINDLSLSVPEKSYFQYEKNNKLYLSDNYIKNTLILMKRYRSSIYSVIRSPIDPGTPKQIWTQYATPFQSKGVAVYGLNLVIIPFGAIDYDDMFIENDEALSNYLIWATIGNLIARQISHHFDVIGIYYWNQTRHNHHLLMNSDGFENQCFGQYMSCHKNTIYENLINMTLPLTSQAISFKIPGHTLNARLSEIMGLRLTYDTLERLKLFSKNHLPWLELNVKQLFYLTYAQMYCTKSLLTTSYISLHENEELPSRIRVFVSASSNELLGQSWNCPQGSQIVPSDKCDVFPHLKFDFEIPSE